MKMLIFPLFLLATVLAGVSTATAESKAGTEAGATPAKVKDVRPATWAQPVPGATLGNFYQVSPELFCSQYPKPEDIANLQRAGIKTIINLRSANDRSAVFRQAGFVTHWHKMGPTSQENLVAVLKLMQTSPKPVLVHCAYGADRTGFIVAGYRIVCQGWTKEEAIKEMRKGGFSFHGDKKIIEALNALDVEAVKKELKFHKAGEVGG